MKGGKESIVSQLAGRLTALKKILQQADFKCKIIVATAVMQSKTHYLLPLHGGAPEYLVRALQVQQLKAARFVCGYSSFYWSTEKLFNACEWMSVRQQEFYATNLLDTRYSAQAFPKTFEQIWFSPTQSGEGQPHRNK